MLSLIISYLPQVLISITLLFITLLAYLYITTPSKATFEEFKNLKQHHPSDYLKNIPEDILKKINWRNRRHYWYPVAYSADINHKKPHGFHLLGEPLVLFRGTSGKVNCLVDRCPHRSTKLSLGSIRDGNLECMYHGWQFSGDGKCQKVPSVDEKKSNFKSLVCADTRVCHEELDIIWVWAGPKSLAHLSLIPRYLQREMFLKNYKMYDVSRPVSLDSSLLVDNFMDQAHVDFTHDGTIGNRKYSSPTNYIEMQNSEYKVPGSLDYKVEVTEGYNKNLYIRMVFVPPCFVKLTFYDKGKVMVQNISVIPTEPGKCLFMDSFYGTLIPPFVIRMISFFSSKYWKGFVTKILNQDLEMLEGVNENVAKGSKVFNKIVNADIMIKKYRDWERETKKEKDPWFVSFDKRDMEDMVNE